MLCLANCGHHRLGSEIHGRGFQVPHTHIPPVPVHSRTRVTPGQIPGPRQAIPGASTRRRHASKEQRGLEVDGGDPAILG